MSTEDLELLMGGLWGVRGLGKRFLEGELKSSADGADTTEQSWYTAKEMS